MNSCNGVSNRYLFAKETLIVKICPQRKLLFSNSKKMNFKNKQILTWLEIKIRYRDGEQAFGKVIFDRLDMGNLNDPLFVRLSLI
jgi:hypothetical protein